MKKAEKKIIYSLKKVYIFKYYRGYDFVLSLSYVTFSQLKIKMKYQKSCFIFHGIKKTFPR